jgi:hypothetical protein
MRMRKYSHSYFSYAVLFALCMVTLLTEYLTEFNFHASIPDVQQWLIRLGSCCAILGSVFCLHGVFREHRRRVLMVRRAGTSETDINSNSIDASRLPPWFPSTPSALAEIATSVNGLYGASFVIYWMGTIPRLHPMAAIPEQFPRWVSKALVKVGLAVAKNRAGGVFHLPPRGSSAEHLYCLACLAKMDGRHRGVVTLLCRSSSLDEALQRAKDLTDTLNGVWQKFRDSPSDHT